jgi:hypothetical protein
VDVFPFDPQWNREFDLLAAARARGRSGSETPSSADRVQTVEEIVVENCH